MDTQEGFFKHQIDCVEKAKCRTFYGLFLECGLGKTRIAIELIKHHKEKTLVIAPNTVLDNWGEEITKWSNLSFVVLKGKKEKRIELLHKQADIYIINYEALRIMFDELIKAKFEFIIADESQKIKSHKSLQSKAAFKLGQLVKRKLIMTGTPITNNPLDIFGQYRFLNPFIFGFSFFRFRSNYAIMGGYMNYQVMRWIHLNELHNKIYSCAVRYTKEQCLDLPQKLYEVIKIEPLEEQKKIYKQLKDNFVAEFKGNIVSAPQVLTRLIRFSQITAGFVKQEEGKEINFESNPKEIWLKEFLEELPSDKKVVVFVKFIREIENTQKLLDAMKIRHVSVYGETTNRQENINQFNNDPLTRVFIGQLDTAGVGVNLTAAHYCIFLTNSYNYGSRIQCEDRLHRIGQDKNVTYIDVVIEGTIDEMVLRCIKSKKSLAEHIIGKNVKEII